MLAEGVETVEQDQFVRAEGVDLIQGFYYSRPLAETQLTEFLPISRINTLRSLTDAV